MQCVVRLRKSDDVSACSLTCQLSMLLRQWLLRLTAFHTVQYSFSQVLGLPSLEEVGWLSKNVPGLISVCSASLYLLYVFCVCSSLFLSSVGFLYTWLTPSEGWGFFVFFTINHNFPFRAFSLCQNGHMANIMGSICSNLVYKVSLC